MGTLVDISHLAYKFCATCFYSGASAFYIAYGLTIVFVSFVPARLNSASLIPIPFLADIKIGEPTKSIQMRIAEVIAFLFSLNAFFFIIHALIFVIKAAANITKPRLQMRTFIRFVNFYFLIIPLPAAFMHPMQHDLRRPDAVLMLAVVLLILTNAIGDLLSFNTTIAFYNRCLKEFHRVNAVGSRGFYKDILLEFNTYIAIVFGAIITLCILAVVLATSSVLFGVQVNQCDFSITTENGAKVLDRILRTHELVREMYWFPNGEPGPFGLPGIPGIFLYGLTTFTPTILMLFFSMIWLFMIPLRLVIFMPVDQKYRILFAEIMVLFVCATASNIFHIDISMADIYRFLNSN